MSKIGLFYASSTGNTEDVAKKIIEKMSGIEIDLKDISDCADDEMKNYDSIIFGISTWGEGELQDNWEEYVDNVNEDNLKGKTVAMFGLGDQDEYGENFLDAMGIIYDKVIAGGATVVGAWPTDGYDFEESTAVRDGKFVGLGLDEDNEFDLTEERTTEWIKLITPHFS